MTLIQATKIIGLKVITLDGGKEIDTVKDVIYDPEENRVKALLIDKQGWFKDAKIISVEKIESIGKDAVIVENEEVIEKARENSDRVANIAHDGNYLTKTKIITVDGDDLGSVTDLYFSLPDGNVHEFEVSGGLISDLKSGRNKISITDIVTIGEDSTIVKSFAEVKIDDQNKTQGAQGVATSLGEIAGAIGHKAGEAWEMAKTKAGEAKEYMDSGKMKSDADELAQKAKDKAQEIKEDLAPKVENIKEKIVDMSSEAKDKAQKMGNEMKDKAEDIKSEVGDRAENIKKDMQPEVENMKNKATDLGSDIKNKAQDMASDSEDFIEDKTNNMQNTYKTKAIGQYLKIDILDVDDEIIAEIGDMVTEEILDEAQENDQLDTLLANLSKEPIKI
jgi:uncharacterized protein YrrD/ElaB/YqjD/DUF883 family membrane-anchored ribosome-binding protein